MNRWIYRSACLTLCLALPLAGCSQKEEEGAMDPTVTVTVAAAETGSLSADGTYIGSISAEGTAYVVTLVSGTVETIGVSVGDEVSAGDLLCHIDDEAALLTLQTAQAAVQTAQAAVSSAQAGKATANAAVSSAEAGMASASAGVASANAGRSTADAGILSAQAGQEQAEAAVDSAQESYRSAVAQYGGSEEDDSLPVIEEQVRLAQENYDNTVALFEIGAASQIEVDQAYQSKISAEAALESAKAGLSSAAAGVAQAESGLTSAAAGQASAQAGVESAQAGMEQAQAGVMSAQAGMEQARAGVQSAQAGMEQAQASVAQAQANVASAEYQLSLYNLTAPISGVVEAVNVTENNFTSSGTAAFVISNGHNKTVTFYVTDRVRQSLKLGQSVTAASGSRTYQGAVTEIGGVVDASAGMFKIKAIIQDADDLPDGLAVEISTAAYSAASAVLIPSDALYFENGETYVYVAENETAVRRDVDVGLYTADTIAVTGGLEPGDQVITSWSASLKDGAPIRLALEG